MNNTMCEKCKYKDTPFHSDPCYHCKFSYPRDSSGFTSGENNFSPAGGESEEVNHPAHYAGEIECIDVMLDTMGPEDVKGFCLCNAFKYLWRCKKKHDTPEEDVEKAVWYLQKYLELGGKS